MSRRLRLMIVCLALVLFTRPAHAQLIVYDPSNFAKNAITAAQMVLQVANSSKEVALMLQNLVPTLGALYPYDPYVRLLQEVLDTVHGGEPMHYYLADLNGRQLDLYRGYTDARKVLGWPANYALLVHTALNAQRGAFNTVHEELKPEDDTVINGVIGDLLGKTIGAFGNKDLAQLNNYHNQLLVTELRRQRHMLGALSNAIMVKQEHDLDLHALTQYSNDIFFLEAKFAVRAYSGAGGIRTISLD